MQGGPGSVRLRFGDGAVQAVPVFGSGGSSAKGGFSVFQYSLTGKEGSGFSSWKTVPAVPVPLSVSGKTVPTVPVSGLVPVRFLSHPEIGVGGGIARYPAIPEKLNAKGYCDTI